MEIRLLTSPAELEQYDAWVRTHPQGTLWQSLAWKRYQDALKRKTHVYAAFQDDVMVASALVTSDSTVMNLTAWDLPRGPLFAEGIPAADATAFFDHIVREAKKDKCFSLYLSPIQSLQATSYKLQASSRHEQPEATRFLDLTLSEEDILKKMHQKGRYNIKVAEKNAVRVEASSDARAFGELLHRTAARDGFAAAPVSRYEAFLKHLDGSFLLLAYASHESRVMSHEKPGAIVQDSRLKTQDLPIAGLMCVIWNGTGIYYYGASEYEHRALMAPYLLQWEAIRHCKAAGCAWYDLLGVAPPDAPDDHPWQGISRFKEKFGGEIVVYPPERQIIVKRAAHAGLQLKRKLLG
jgi:lipid II:glycine glycyltransferase (peptidoglycan interpeptide bridge formation enzyme)